MDRLADGLDQAADKLTTMDKRMSGHAVPAKAFGAAGAEGGMPGALGRELHEHWRVVLDARSLEAAGAASRLGDMAQSVRATLQHYDETDDLVRRRLTREM